MKGGRECMPTGIGERVGCLSKCMYRLCLWAYTCVCLSVWVCVCKFAGSEESGDQVT